MTVPRNLIVPLIWQIALAGLVCKLTYILDAALLTTVVTKLIDTLHHLVTKLVDTLLDVVSNKLIDVLAVKILDSFLELISLLLLWSTTTGAQIVFRFAFLAVSLSLLFSFLLSALPYVSRTLRSPGNSCHMQHLAPIAGTPRSSPSTTTSSSSASSNDYPGSEQQPVPTNQQTSPEPNISILPAGQTLPAGSSLTRGSPHDFASIFERHAPSESESESSLRTVFRTETLNFRPTTLNPERPTIFTALSSREPNLPSLPPPDFTTTRETAIIPDDSSGVPSRSASPPLSDVEPVAQTARSYQSRKEPVKHPTAMPAATSAETETASPAAATVASDQPFPFPFARPPFPKPTDFSLPGPFCGRGITAYFEAFQDALEDHGLTRDAQIYNRWLRWCNEDNKRYSKRLWNKLGVVPASQTWANFKKRMREKTKMWDPRQSDDPTEELRRFFTTTLGTSADETIDGLHHLQALLAEVPWSEQATAEKEAVVGFFNMLDPELQGTLTGTDRNVQDIKRMSLEDFDSLLVRTCSSGYRAQGRYTKLSKAVDHKHPAPAPTQPATRKPKAAPVPFQPEQPITILKREEPSPAMDDLASQVARLTLMLGQKEPELMKTFYQQPPAQSYSQNQIIPPSRQLMPLPNEELQTNFMRTGRFNPQMGGSHDGQFYMGSRNAYNGQTGGGQGSYFTSDESILGGRPNKVPMLPYDQTRTGRPMTRYFCHGCGDPSHRCFPNQCPEYGAIEHFGLGFLKDGFLYIGSKPASPLSQPDADLMVYPGLLRQAQQAGAIWQLVVAIYQRFQNNLPSQPDFSEYCIKKDRRNYVAPVGLLQLNGQDPPWILQGRQFNQPPAPQQKALDVVQTNISRMEDRGRPLFDYLDKGDVRVISYRRGDARWIQEAFPNKHQGIYQDSTATTLMGASAPSVPTAFRHLQIEDVEEDDSDKENWTPESSRDVTPDLPQPNPLPPPNPPNVPHPARNVPAGRSTERPLPLRERHPCVGDSNASARQSTAQLETDAVEALNLLHETDARKRARVDDPSSDDEQGGVSARPNLPAQNADAGVQESAAATPARKILRPKPPRRPVAPTALPSSLIDTLLPKATSEQAISETIATLLGKQIQVPLRQLLALNGGLVRSLQAFLEAQQSIDDVITLTETGVPETGFQPRHGENASTNVNLVGGVNTLLPPAARMLNHDVPFFATLAHGELALMNADVLRDFLTLRQRPKDPPTRRSDVLHTAIDALTLSQKAALLLATRYHHLPRMFLQLGDHSTKVCAIIDTGSECNLIPRSIVDSRGIAWTPTATVSIGLHGKESFTGECITTVWFGDLCVKTHFFILDDKAKDYELILGMPFIRDTKLTFEYLDTGAIRAKVVLDNKLILASCFNPAFTKSA